MRRRARARASSPAMARTAAPFSALLDFIAVGRCLDVVRPSASACDLNRCPRWQRLIRAHVIRAPTREGGGRGVACSQCDAHRCRRLYDSHFVRLPPTFRIVVISSGIFGLLNRKLQGQPLRQSCPRRKVPCVQKDVFGSSITQRGDEAITVITAHALYAAQHSIRERRTAGEGHIVCLSQCVATLLSRLSNRELHNLAPQQSRIVTIPLAVGQTCEEILLGVARRDVPRAPHEVVEEFDRAQFPARPQCRLSTLARCTRCEAISGVPCPLAHLR